MRHAIWKKDDYFTRGGEKVAMDASAVRLVDDVIPLYWGTGFDAGDNIVGSVTELLVKDDEITGNLICEDSSMGETLDEALREGHFRVGGMYVDVRELHDGEESRVTNCRLRAVGVFAVSANPGARV